MTPALSNPYGVPLTDAQSQLLLSEHRGNAARRDLVEALHIVGYKLCGPCRTIKKTDAFAFDTHQPHGLARACRLCAYVARHGLEEEEE